MKFLSALQRCLTVALFSFVVLLQPASADDECIPVERVIPYLLKHQLDYAVVSGPAVKAWTSQLLNDNGIDIPASNVIVAFNPKTGKGIALFVMEGAVCLAADFSLANPPTPLLRS